MKLTNYGYDSLKFVALVLLPGLSAAYFGLAQIWHLPNAEEVVGTATILDTFLGLLLKASSSKYVPDTEDNKPADGELVVTHDEDGAYLGVAWAEQSQGLKTNGTVKLDVVHVRQPNQDGKETN